MVTGYPPAAQMLGQLVNAIFLDGIEEDVARMERMNDLLRKMAPHERDGLKPIDLLVLRPSIDLGKLAATTSATSPARSSSSSAPSASRKRSRPISSRC